MSLFANWWGMRHVRTSPLGISQKQKMEKKPGWWRVVPLLISLIILVYMTVHDPEDGNEVLMMTNIFLFLIVAMMFSLVIVTPWLTYHLSSLVSRLAKRPTVLIGTKYIHGHARAIARSVSGVVLALFAGSFYILGTSGVAALEAKSIRNNGYSILRDNTAIVQGLSSNQASQLEQELSTGNPDFAIMSDTTSFEQVGDYVTGKCLALNSYVNKLDCGQGELAAIDFYLATDDSRQVVYANNDDDLHSRIRTNIDQIYEGENVDEQMDQHSTVYIASVADADTEKLRSAVAKLTGGVRPTGSVQITSAAEAKNPVHQPNYRKPGQPSLWRHGGDYGRCHRQYRRVNHWRTAERRRSMYMLRLSGMQVDELKHMVVIESLTPLVVMSLISAGIGAWSGSAFTKIGSTTLHPTITPMYVAVVIGSLVVATIAIWLILPMISRLTSPEANQTE